MDCDILETTTSLIYQSCKPGCSFSGYRKKKNPVHFSLTGLTIYKLFCPLPRPCLPFINHPHINLHLLCSTCLHVSDQISSFLSHLIWWNYLKLAPFLTVLMFGAAASLFFFSTWLILRQFLKGINEKRNWFVPVPPASAIILASHVDWLGLVLLMGVSLTITNGSD